LVADSAEFLDDLRLELTDKNGKSIAIKIPADDIRDFLAKKGKLKLKIHTPLYLDDSRVNGVDCTDDALSMPFTSRNPDDDARNGLWDIEIDVDSGTIIGWPQGTTADVHYKVCDEGTYTLVKDDGSTQEYQDYVPDFLAIGDYGYGDYIIFSVDESGKILPIKINPEPEGLLEWSKQAVIDFFNKQEVEE
jgi:hypothetical protein